MIVVVDASVAAMWYLPQAHSEHAMALLASDHDLVAPELLRLEVGSVLLRAVRRRAMTRAEAREAVGAMLPEGVRLVPVADGSVRALDVAAEFGGSIYDAVYVALARDLGAPISTSDAQLVSTARKAGVPAALIRHGVPALERVASTR